MGTKRPNCTHFDTTSNLNTADYKLQSGGNISQDSCPKLKMTGPSERDRNATREENWKRDTESEKVRDRARYREMDTLERPYERDRALSPRPREGEREWMERDPRQEHDLDKNGRLQSNAERQNEQEVKTGRKKGDTYPRIRKEDTKTRRMKEDEEREEMRQRDRPLREEVDEWERERRRNRYEESYEVRSRAKEEGKNLGGRRAEDERLQQRKRRNVPGVDFQDRTRDLRDSRERDVARRRERLRPDMDERETRIYSPHRRPDGEIYSDRRERENKREKRRDARSEGDIDDREMMRCRLKDRERDEMTYQLSRSEGENWSRTERERDRDRQYYTDRLRQKEVRCRRLDAEKEREMYKDVEWRAARETDREEERWRERGLKGEMRVDDRSRGERTNRERKERWEDATDRNSRSPTDSASKIPTQVQSSREWSRDVDSKTRYRGDGDRYEERETRSERTGESERGKEGWKDSERTADRKQRQLRSERQERERRIMSGSLPEQRRMWLEPQRGKNSKDEFVHRETHTRRKEGRSEEERKIESQEERGRERRRVKEEPDERYLDPNGYKGRHGGRSGSMGDPEEVSVDRDEDSEIWRDTDKGGKEHLSDSDGRIEGRQLRDMDGGNVLYNTEESDREEERGNHYWARSESEGGSEVEWKQDRDRVLSGEDGFVTVSSDGDEEHERDKENEFKYCQEFLEGGITHEESTPVGFKGSVGDKERGEEWTMKREEAVDEEGQGRGKYVFCVIGQTLSQSKSGEMSLSQDDQKGGAERNNWHLEFQHYHCDDDTQKSQEDIQLTSNRNDDVSVPNKDSERDHSTSQEEDLTLEHTAEGEFQYRRSPELRSPEPGEEMKSKVEPLLIETGTIKRDSQTERLLKEWREKDDDAGGNESGHTSPLPSNPYANVCSQDNLNESFLDSINTAAMSVEELEAIKVRMNEAWSTSEEPKRRSQAPHLKWAKSVVREILGHSDEQTVDESITEAQGDQGVNQSESNKEQEDVKQSTADLPVVTFTKYKQTSVPEREEEYPLDEYREDDDHSKSWGEVDLRNVLDSIARRKRNSKIFNAAQLYQQYSEAAQNSEIVSQSRSSTLSVCEDNIPSPTPSPPPARRPLPPLPAVRHPHSLSHSGSITSAKSLPLPEPPKIEGRPPSPRLSFSISKSVTLWRDLPGVRNSSELEELTEGQRRLQEVRFEVVTSEASYCRSLDIVVEHFVKSKQLRALLTTQDRNWLFSRLADVRAISHSFLSKLEECVESDIMHFTVCDIIARQCGRFKMVYVPYLTNQSYQDATYQRLMNENPGFKAIVEKLERSPVCQRLPLRSFLVLPFQRITRIKLLVQNIVKRTTPGTPEAMQAIRALKLLEKLIQESNDSISQMKSIESLVSLSAKVDFGCRTLPLVSQSRRLVREGPVTELMDLSQKETERNVYLHLFNDHLLLSQQKEGGRFTVIDHCPVSQLRAENCRVKLHSLQKNLIRLHMSNRALLLRTDTQSDKLRWISALSRPHTEIDFSAAQDFEQMQCIRAFVAQQPDELSLEKADIILVHQESTDNWVEGTRLSDRHRGWVPKAHLETISSSRVRQRNLSDALKLTTATATV